jgi:hypothetical protein
MYLHAERLLAKAGRQGAREGYLPSGAKRRTSAAKVCTSAARKTVGKPLRRARAAPSARFGSLIRVHQARRICQGRVAAGTGRTDGSGRRTAARAWEESSSLTDVVSWRFTRIAVCFSKTKSYPTMLPVKSMRGRATRSVVWSAVSSGSRSDATGLYRTPFVCPDGTRLQGKWRLMNVGWPFLRHRDWCGTNEGSEGG